MSQPINGAAPAPPQITPQPMPFGYDFSVVRANEGVNLVAMTLSTVSGVIVLFLTPDGAQKFGHALQSAVGQARSGLILPNGLG